MRSDTPRIAIIAALPREIADFTREWPRQDVEGVRPGLILGWSDRAVALAGGIGAANAVRALHEVLAFTPINFVVSAGFAGALRHDIEVGQVLRPSTIIDAQTGERFSVAHGDGTLAVTTPVIANAEEKLRLEESYGAHIAEMEAAGLARACLAAGIPFAAIKAVSDDAFFSLPVLQKFTTPAGQFRTAAFAFHVAVRPHLWHAAATLGIGAAKASEALGTALTSWLATHSQQDLSLKQ